MTVHDRTRLTGQLHFILNSPGIHTVLQSDKQKPFFKLVLTDSTV